jgi:hypothetical protein
VERKLAARGRLSRRVDGSSRKARTNGRRHRLDGPLRDNDVETITDREFTLEG